MKIEPVTFRRFSEALGVLGFVRREVHVDGRSSIVFHHAETGTIVVLPPLKASDPVPPGEVMSARYLFHARGVTIAEHLDELLSRAPAATAR